jgi:hypothetical protein
MNPWNIKDTNAWINIKAVEHPWRLVNGQTNFIPWAKGWSLFSAEAMQVHEGHLLVSGYASGKGGVSNPERQAFLIKKYPGKVVDGDKLPPFVAKHVGETSYKTVLGIVKTVRVYDWGEICAPTSVSRSLK